MNWNHWFEQIGTYFEKHETLWAWLGGLSVITLAGALIAAFLILILLPSDYLKKSTGQSRSWPPLLRIPYLVVKNVFGIVFILAGFAMLFLPGQGLLTLFVGLLLLDLPGKRRLIHRILGQKRIFHYINTLRAKAQKPPLEKPEIGEQ